MFGPETSRGLSSEEIFKNCNAMILTISNIDVDTAPKNNNYILFCMFIIETKSECSSKLCVDSSFSVNETFLDNKFYARVELVTYIRRSDTGHWCRGFSGRNSLSKTNSKKHFLTGSSLFTLTAVSNSAKRYRRKQRNHFETVLHERNVKFEIQALIFCDIKDIPGMPQSNLQWLKHFCKIFYVPFKSH